MAKERVTIQELILLYLFENKGFEFDDKWIEYTQYNLTQNGISDVLGISQGHVSVELKRLINKGLVRERVVPIKGKIGRRKAYFLTSKGVEIAKEIKNKLEKKVVEYDGKNLKLSELKKIYSEKLGKNVTLVEMYLMFHKTSRKKYKIVSNGLPELKNVYGREKEEKSFMDFINSNKHIVIITGIPGIGKTVFARKMVEHLKNRYHIFWYTFHQYDTLPIFLSDFSTFLEKIGLYGLKKYLKYTSNSEINFEEIYSILKDEFIKLSNAVMFFDNFEYSDSEIVKYVRMISDFIKSTSSKLVIITREIPHEIIDIHDVISKNILEIKMDLLSKDAVKKWLEDMGIHDKITLDTVYEITKGFPLSISLTDFELYRYSPKNISRYFYYTVYSTLTDIEREIVSFISLLNKPVNYEFISNFYDYKYIDKLIRKNILEENERGEIYAHSVIKEFFSASLSEKDKNELHTKIGKFFEESGDYAQALYHYIHGNKINDAVKLIKSKSKIIVNQSSPDFLLELLNKIENCENDDIVEIIKTMKGEIYSLAGKWEYALKTYKELIKNKNLNDEQKVNITCKLARTYIHLGNIKEGIKLLENCEKKYFDNIDNETKLKVLQTLVMAYYTKNEIDEAKKYGLKALDITKTMSIKKAWIYNMLGIIHSMEKNYDKAIDLFNESLKIANKTKNIRGAICVLNNIGFAYYKKKDYNSATRFLTSALFLAKETNLRRSEAVVSISLSKCYREIGKIEDAEQLLKRITKCCENVLGKKDLGDLYYEYATILKLKGHSEYREFMKKSMEIYKELGLKKEKCHKLQ